MWPIRNVRPEMSNEFIIIVEIVPFHLIKQCKKAPKRAETYNLCRVRWSLRFKAALHMSHTKRRSTACEMTCCSIRLRSG